MMLSTRCFCASSRLLFLALWLFIVPSSSSPTSRQAYVTLLYGNSYLLAVRVMMRSLIQNSPDVSDSLRERIVLVTGNTSPQSIDQLRADGVTVISVPATESPYTRDPKYQSRFVFIMTKLTIFNMTQYSRLVFIDADNLVVGDLSPLFQCGHFCAVFINPCYFNAGLMVVTPNSTVFQHMQEVLPSTPSYDGGDQGFLNSYYPQLIDAPMFDVHSPAASLPLFSRLPFSWHVDHSSHFPTFAFEFEKSDRCGPRRNMEWLGPPIFKPWLWYTYAFFDLSWTWNSYRRQLSNTYPPGLGTRPLAVILVVLCYYLLFWLMHTFGSRRTTPLLLLRTLPKCCPFPNISNDMSAVYPVVAGTILWVFLFSMCLLLVPPFLSPYPATFVFFHLRAVTNLVLLVVVGLALCLGQRRSGKERPAHVLPRKDLRNIFRRMVFWAVGDAALLIVWIAVLWQISFQTMWTKAVAIFFAAATEGITVLVMISDTTLVWLRLSDSVGSHLEL